MRRERLIAAILFVLIVTGYCIIAGSALSRAYIDLGDGNYLYTSGRMADGLMIYRDFLSPQPPLHLLTGSLLVRLGRSLGDPLMTVRVFSLALHVLTLGLMFLLGWRVTRAPLGGVLAALCYGVLPIGFWWSMGYQSELLEIVWLLSALLCFLPLRPRGVALAGGLMALAVLTNMTAAPYAVAILVYLIFRHPRRLLPWFLIPFGIILGGVVSYYQFRTGGYFENVIFNQVGSYPKGDFWNYAIGKISSQGTKILQLEGGFILLALLGLIAYSRHEDRPEREFMVWYALVLLLSLVYVTKGGTMDYIFTLGEPMVGLFAAYFLVGFFRFLATGRVLEGSFWRDTRIVPYYLFMALALLTISYNGFNFINATLHQRTFEQSEEECQKLEYFIEQHSRPGDRILAPPFYAFATDRLLVEEYSELYLWSLKYSLERQEGKEGAGVLRVRNIAAELEQGKIPVVVADVNPGPIRPGVPLSEWANPPGSSLILRSEEVRSAIEKHYKPLLKADELFPSLNARWQVFVPK